MRVGPGRGTSTAGGPEAGSVSATGSGFSAAPDATAAGWAGGGAANVPGEVWGGPPTAAAPGCRGAAESGAGPTLRAERRGTDGGLGDRPDGLTRPAGSRQI